LISTNEIAKNKEFGCLTLYTKDLSPKVVVQYDNTFWPKFCKSDELLKEVEGSLGSFFSLKNKK